jgi:hypothetical protein
MRQKFMAAVTEEDIDAIVRALIDKAKQGDCAAVRIVLQYTVGKPVETVDPDRLDEMEWQQWQREKVTAESASVYNSTAASTACTLARILVPVAQTQQLETIEQNRQARNEERRREEERRQHTAQRRAERKARRAETQAAEAAAAGPAPGKEEAGVAAVPAQVEATTEAHAPLNVVPVEAAEVDNGGQTAAMNARAKAVERALRLLESTVTKREETAPCAGNGLGDGEGHADSARLARPGDVNDKK